MTGSTLYSQTLRPTDAERSPRVSLIHKLFGLAPHLSATPLLDEVEVPTQGITLIVGPSGAGKSTLLGLIARDRPDAQFLPHVESRDASIVDMVEMAVTECIQWFGRFGLGEARILTTPYSHLSDGQKVRARLALLMAARPSCVVLDEFVSVLDRLTAKFVAFNFQKMCRLANTTAYIATAHDDLTEAIAPDHLIQLDLAGSARVTPYRQSAGPRVAELGQVVIDGGTPEDYRALARFHYIEHLSSDAPQTHADWQHSVSEIRTARYNGQPVGVALFARPVPNFLERLPYFRTLNERALVLLRIVVHPTFRGVGLTRRILDPALAASTRCIVSCSALGVYFPFHLSAGFQPVPHPRNRRYQEHDELESLLAAAGVPSLDALNRYSDAQQFYDSLTPDLRTPLRRLVTTVALRQNVEYCQFFAQLVGLSASPDAYTEELSEVFLSQLDGVPEDQFGTVLSEALHLPVQGFVKMVNGSSQPELTEPTNTDRAELPRGAQP